MGGGSQPSTTTSTTEPWSAQKPYLEKGFEEAGKIYDQGPQKYYPGQTYVDQSDPTKAALAQTQQIATGGNALVDNASGYVNNTLTGQGDNPYSNILNSGTSGMQATARGDFLNSNPHLDSTFDAANKKLTTGFQNTTLPSIAAGLGSSGMAGSTQSDLLGAEAGGKLADAQAGLASSIYGGNYQSERDRMTAAQSGLTSTGAGLYSTNVNERLAALGQAPGLREAQYGDAGKLGEVGKAQEGQSEKVLEDDINRFNYGQNAATASLQDYLAMISGNFGSTSTSRSTAAKGSGVNTAAGIGSVLASLFA